MADNNQLCNALSKSLGSRRCLPSGGIKPGAWVGQVSDLIGARTYKPNGALSSFTLATGAMFIKATGRAKKGSGASAITQPEDGSVSNEQTVVLEFAYGTQHEADALVEFLRADGKFVLLETNAGTVRGYFMEFGHASAAGEEGTGTLIADASGVLKITLKGTESTLPIFFEAVNANPAIAQVAASRAYLDGLVTGAEVID